MTGPLLMYNLLSQPYLGQSSDNDYPFSEGHIKQTLEVRMIIKTCFWTKSHHTLACVLPSCKQVIFHPAVFY